MWCVLELNLSIVGGSMPAMKPVLQKYFPRLLASTQGASESGNYYMDDTRSKPKRSRITDPYNISRDRDSKSDSDSERRIVNEVVKKHGGTGFELARSEKEARDLWADRKNALYSGLALVEGCRGWSTDVW